MIALNATCECGKPRHRNALCCASCRDADRVRYDDTTSVRAQLVSLLYRHRPDWLPGYEIRAVINDPDCSVVLGRLVARGEVESQRMPGEGVWYRWSPR